MEEGEEDHKSVGGRYLLRSKDLDSSTVRSPSRTSKITKGKVKSETRKGSATVNRLSPVKVTTSSDPRMRGFSREGDIRQVTFSCDEVTASSVRGSGDGFLQPSGYEILKYIVERQDKRWWPILLLPTTVFISTVILWSLSIVSLKLGLVSGLSALLWAYIRVWNTVIEETLVIVSTSGIQVHQTNILGKMKYAKFVPIENIRAVVINEIIRRQRVIAYLLVVLDSSESTGKIMVPLLIGTLPRLRTIEKIYSHIQRVIFSDVTML